MEISKMLNTKEVAKILNCSTSYVSRLCKSKKIPSTKAFGGLKVPYEELMKIIQKQLKIQECL